MKNFLYIFTFIITCILGILGASYNIFLPVAIVGFIFIAVIIFKNYEIGTYFIALYVLMDYFIRNFISIPALSSLWDELLFLSLFLLWIYKWIVHRKDTKYRWTPLETPIILFFLIGIFLIIVNSPDLRITIEGFRAVVQYILWYFIVVQLLKTRSGAKKLFVSLVFIGIILGIHGVYQYIIGVEMPQHWIDSLEKGLRTRVFSIIGSPNILGSLMTLTIPMSISLVFAEKKTGKKIFFLCASIIMTACLIFTFSRAALIGFIIAMAIFALLKDRRLIIPAVICAILVIILVPSIVDRFTYLLSPTYIEKSLQGGRLTRWLTGLEMLKEQPLFGVGLGHFGGAVAMNNDIPNTFYMDNYFLKTAVEMGIIGLAAFMYLMYQVVIWSYKTLIKMKDRYFINITIGALSGMIGVIVHNFFENVFEVPMMTTYFWVLAGIIMFLRSLNEDNEKINNY